MENTNVNVNETVENKAEGGAVEVDTVEVKKENATNNNVDLSKLENKVIEDFANIIVEIVIPE